jgi:type VI secretion system protein ImpB
MKPRVAFAVPNTLTGDGNVSVDVTFESMDDFSPDVVAEKIEPLKKLLDVRNELSNLMTYMDGKSGAEELMAKLMQDPALLASLTATPNAAAPEAEAEPASSDDDSPSEGGDDSPSEGDDLLSDL